MLEMSFLLPQTFVKPFCCILTWRVLVIKGIRMTASYGNKTKVLINALIKRASSSEGVHVLVVDADGNAVMAGEA